MTGGHATVVDPRVVVLSYNGDGRHTFNAVLRDLFLVEDDVLVLDGDLIRKTCDLIYDLTRR